MRALRAALGQNSLCPSKVKVGSCGPQPHEVQTRCSRLLFDCCGDDG